MTEQTSSIISKVWSLCNPLRDDGVSYGDYLEQLTVEGISGIVRTLFSVFGVLTITPHSGV